jgi:hypothetical protein
MPRRRFGRVDETETTEQVAPQTEWTTPANDAFAEPDQNWPTPEQEAAQTAESTETLPDVPVAVADEPQEVLTMSENTIETAETGENTEATEPTATPATPAQPAKVTSEEMLAEKFPVGTLVEVTTKGSDFSGQQGAVTGYAQKRGAWYVALDITVTATGVRRETPKSTTTRHQSLSRIDAYRDAPAPKVPAATPAAETADVAS